MASVKVAVRVRPFNQREIGMQAKLIIDMKGKKTRIVNSKVADGKDGDLGRERYKDFTFDYSYWSYDSADPHYASQEQVFRDLGMDVIDCAFEGYNACVFAYGQTGSGKTFTMMGAPECIGLIPRICQTLFSKQQENISHSAAKYTYRTEVSYLEIYNERVRDLLSPSTNHSLRVREHPRQGPYVQDLSKHLVTNYAEIEELMIRGNNVRTTASTNMNDVSSRSHAIFTILFTQACFSGDFPTETISKVHLVDLAGSERADATGATGKRLQEGAHINKSLVTLGSVISALADVSSPASDGSSGSGRKTSFIPYRDSVLTWLLKDSLGGNSKTIMIAAVSPADCNYGETLSTLRYANRAKNIVNKPTVNEDSNVRLIRELREEIARLRALRDSEMTTSGGSGGVLAQLHQTEARAQALTEEWAEKWRETAQILSEQQALGLRKAGKGVVLDSDRPHLVGIDDDLRSTGVTLYHLKEGKTHIGSEEGADCDIMLSGLNVEKNHCTIELSNGVATLLPAPQAQCWVNTVPVDKPTKLSQGCIILLGRTNMFRYNDPVEAAKLRKEGSRSHLNLSRLSLLSWSTPDLNASLENLHINEDGDLNESGTFKGRRSSLLFRDKEETKSQRDQYVKQQALEEAQQALDEERERLEQSYLAQSRRLAEDWQRLEQQQQESRASLVQRETELQQLREALEWERTQQASRVEADNVEVARLQSELERKGEELNKLKAKMSSWSGDVTPTTDSSNQTSPPPLSSPSAIDSESIDSWASTAPGSAVEVGDNDAMKLLIEQHKRHIMMLDAEFQKKVAALAEGRARAERLESDINIVQNAEPTTLPVEELKRMISERTQEELQQILERKKSFKLDLKERLAPSNSVPVASSSQQSTLEENASSAKRFSDHATYETPMVTATEFLETPYLPALSEVVDDESFHTACASPSNPCTSFSSAIQDSGTVDTGVLSDSGVELDTRSSLARDPLLHSWLQASSNNVVARALPQCDDSDDVSSTEDCLSNKPTTARGEGSSSRVRLHRPPRHIKHGILSLRRGDSELNVRDAMRAMQTLYQRVNNQKTLVIQSLEDDCGKQELNERIAVLQELQKQYLCLELALEQHTGKENRSSLTNLSTLPTLGSIEDSDDMSTSADDMMSEPSYINGHRESLDHSGLSNTLSPLNPATLNSQDDNFSTVSLAHSRTSLHSCDDGEIIHIPSFLIRGAGSSTHYEYEVRVNAGGERWVLLRRYRRFRELHLQMREKYGSLVSSLDFPPRRLFSKRSEVVASKRRAQLENYLRALIRVCSTVAGCPLHQARDNLTRLALIEFSPFFRKGVFESGKYGTS